MDDYSKNVLEAAHFIKKKIDTPPRIGFLTGTGLGASVASMEIACTLPYREIPHCPVSTVESHPGRLLFGTLAGVPLMVMQGRFHLYEGYTPLEVTFPIRVMQAMGIDTLIVSNASGGLNLDFAAGDIMILTDHINLTGENPLIGPNIDRWGIRFPDMTGVYDPRLIDLVWQSRDALCNVEKKKPESAGSSTAGSSTAGSSTAGSSTAGSSTAGSSTAGSSTAGLSTAGESTAGSSTIQKGVYAGLKGPSLETPAETRYLKTIGADAVGFSTVLEVIAAVHAGMKILGLATITNINNPDTPQKATLEEIIQVAKRAAGTIDRLLTAVLPRI